MNLPKRMNDVPYSNQQKLKKKSNSDLNESDDFWRDCEENVEMSHKSSSSDMKNNFHTPAFSTKTESSNSNTQIRANVKEFLIQGNEKKEDYVTFDIKDEMSKKKAISSNNVREQKFQKLLNKYDYEEEEEVVPVKKEKEEKKVTERFEILYEKGKIKNELIKMMHEKNNEIKAQQELSECTFKPRLNIPKKSKNGSAVKKSVKEQRGSIYTRNVYWNQQKTEKITKEKNFLNRQNDDYTFKPQTHKANMDSLFNQEKSIIFDPNSRQFVERYEKARKEDEEKKKRVVADLTKVSEKKWGKKLTHRSASAENNILFYENSMNNSMVNINAMKRNLHEELHAFDIQNDLLENNLEEN